MAGGPAYLAPVAGGYLTCLQPKTVGQQTITVWEVNKGADRFCYYNDSLREKGCTKTNASVTFYAYDAMTERTAFEDDVIAKAKKNALSKPEYITGDKKDLSENEKILLEACDYVMSTCTYPCNDFGYVENWGYVNTLKKYGKWWDSRQVDSNIGPGLLMQIAERLGADLAFPHGGDEHAYVTVSINGNYYPNLCMTPHMNTGAVNPDRMEYFDFSRFK